MTQTTAVAKAAQEKPDARLVTLLESCRTIEERAQVFSAMERHRQSKIIREAAKIISGTTWGRQLSPYAQAAIAQYALSCGTDPVRHWEVLGGKLYDTAALWLDIAASAADYNGYEAEDLTWSDELTADERDRRKTERARWGLPQDVAGACVVRIYRKGIDRPFVGANHAGNRRTYRAEKLALGDKLDPIGEQDPGKTAFTRAFRRAAKTAWPLWPYRRALPGDEGIATTELLPGSADRQEGKQTVEAVIEQGKEAARVAEKLPPMHAYPGDPEAHARAEDRQIIDDET